MPVGGNGIAQREGQIAEANPLMRRVRVVLYGESKIDWAGELPFEILRCKDATLLGDICRGVTPTVLLVDLRLQAAPSEELDGRLGRPQTIAIDDAASDVDCERLLRAGFAGLLQRNASPATLIRAVSAVANGQLWFPRETVSRVLKGYLAGRDRNQLTPRESEIFALIGGGLSNQQIADKLFISRETVRWHVRGLYAKLGIENRNGAKEYLQSPHTPVPIPVRPETRKEGTHTAPARPANPRFGTSTKFFHEELPELAGNVVFIPSSFTLSYLTGKIGSKLGGGHQLTPSQSVRGSVLLCKSCGNVVVK